MKSHGLAYNAARHCLYVAMRYGTLWRVPLDGQTPSTVASGMGNLVWDVAVQEEADPATGIVARWAYVLPFNGKLWRVDADSPVDVPVSEELNLAVYNLGSRGMQAVDFDCLGNAWIRGYDDGGVLWKFAGLFRPASRRLVTKTPGQDATTGDRPDFTGTVPTPAPVGTTVHATDEKGAHIAENITVNPDTGAWIFDRDPKTGPWTPGTHTVSVVTVHSTNVSARATSPSPPRHRHTETHQHTEYETALAEDIEALLTEMEEAGYVTVTDG